MRLNWPRMCSMFCSVHSRGDRKSTRLNSSHDQISYAVFCLKKKKRTEPGGSAMKSHALIPTQIYRFVAELCSRKRLAQPCLHCEGQSIAHVTTPQRYVDTTSHDRLMSIISISHSHSTFDMHYLFARFSQYHTRIIVIFFTYCLRLLLFFPSLFLPYFFFFFFLNNTAPPEFYPFPLPAAFPI